MNETLLILLLAAGAALAVVVFVDRFRPKTQVPAPVPVPQSSPDRGYALMSLLQGEAMSRAGNRVIDGAAEAMADDTVAALVRGAGTAKGAAPSPSPSPSPDAPRPN